MALERIQKILAAAGFGSRRECEQLVEEGHVRVNAHVRDTLPLFVDPEVDRITVKKKPIRAARIVYFILNKPPGYHTHESDLEGRKTIAPLISRIPERVHPVGRTEPDCAGLVLLTNDKDLARAIADPRRGPAKVYRVEVKGAVEPDALAALRQGMRLSEGRISPMVVKVVHGDRQRTILEVSSHDRLQREIPRVLAKHGMKVKHMIRVALGRIDIRKLPVAAVRPLLPDEVAYLKKCVESGGESGEFSAESGVNKPRRSRTDRSRSGPGARRKSSAGTNGNDQRQNSAGASNRTAGEADRPADKRKKSHEIETRLSNDPGAGSKKKRRIIGFDD